MSPTKKTLVLIAGSVLCAAVQAGQAQQSTTTTTTAPPGPVAGRAVLGVTVVEMEAVIAGWSVKKDLLKKNVTNDKNEKIGTIDDIIVSPSKEAGRPAATFVIIGVGGFLGIGKRDVAIPIEQVQLQGTRYVLPGATKDALKALPPFVYKR
jgi:sporulation protein YlmC with PRC-barrel domain